jgi:hypothetical protein
MAAQHLESLRGSGIGYNVDDLYLGENVCPVYRPDIKGPAYYEFEVLKATKDKPDGRDDLVDDVLKTNVLDAGGYSKIYTHPTFPVKIIGEDMIERFQTQVQGFIMVSTSGHDFPIPHWSFDHQPVSFHLELEAAKAKKKISRINKLDSLCYVGEDSMENEVTSIGSKPSFIKKLPEKLSLHAGRISSVAPKEVDKDRHLNPDLQKMNPVAMQRRGPKAPDLEMVAAPDLKTLKNNFEKSFKPMLDALRIKAEETWQIEHVAREFGEGIMAGKVHCVPLLSKDFSLRVTGEAAEHVKVRIVERPGGNASAELECSKTGLGRESHFSLHIKYGDGNREKLEFFIFEKGMPTEHKSVIEEE